ncbi:MAG: bifunctional glycosyltransferase family 2/GtrA family protein [Kiritimatiellae bacterium]|nr:bifunctional glycosyltransferase family 2/GtrA family protein [Kiritimatiellia bacterium]
METIDNVAVCIPVFNPEPGLLELCDDLLRMFRLVIVVDDGSCENQDMFGRLPKDIILLKHTENLGKGRAIKTALTYLVNNRPEVTVAVFSDGDGQHRPCDVQKVAAYTAGNGNVAIGVRDFSRSGIPFRSKFGNVLTSFLVRKLYGIPIYDTQTGLRAIPCRLFNEMLLTPGERYEYEMRLFGMLHRTGDLLMQIPIATVYNNGNRASHFQPIRDSLRVYRGLLGDTFAKFCVSSVLAFLADNVIFTFLLFFLQGLGWLRRYDILASLVVARMVSSSINYLCNRIFVFKSAARLVSSYTRYWALVFFVAILSYIGTACLSAALDASGLIITVVKIVVEMILFVISYRCQKHWVFIERASSDEKKN